jgi:ubiquinone/menaquinone biosynthesis C-methylase UbiE
MEDIMITDKEKITSMYNNGKEEDRATESRATALEFHYTKKFLEKYINNSSNVIEIGCGTGYYAMFFADKCEHFTGIDLAQGNIDIFNQKISKAGYKNISTMVGDATNLPEISDNSFDIVLCLGPMYHLPQNERMKVFDECYRIAKNGAILAFAYINRLGVYAGACVNDKWRDI